MAAAQPPEVRLGRGRELLDDLDAPDLTHQFRQHRRLVAKAGADLQSHLMWLEIEEIGHDGDDEGL